jgi:hypothetical protein
MRRYTISDCVRDGWFLWLLMAFLVFAVCKANSAPVIMEWQVSPTNVNGEVNSEWSYCQWYLWTNAAPHAASNAVATGFVSATTNPPNWTACSATWSNGVPGKLYWSRIVTVNADGQASAMSEAQRNRAAPAPARNEKVRVDG